MSERTRSKSKTAGADSYSAVTVLKYNGTVTQTVPEGSGSFFRYSEDTEMIDTVTPGFKNLSRQGKIVNNAMRKTTVNRVLAKGNCAYSFHNVADTRYTGVTSGTFHPPGYWSSSFLPDPVANDLESLKAQAITSAWSRANPSETDSLVSLMELDDTVVGLVRIFLKLQKIVSYVRRKKWQRLKELITLREMTNVWMEARYGIRPLYYDALKIINAYHKMSTLRPIRRTSRGRASETEICADTVGTLTLTQEYSGLWFESVWDRTTRSTITARAGVLADYRPTLEQLWGLSLDSVPRSAWEVVPLSFVIDWFINLGDVITSLTPVENREVLASWVTVTHTLEQSMFGQDIKSVTGCPAYPYALTDIGGYSGTAIKTTISKVRTPNPDRPWLPSIRFKLDVLKLIDLLIIIKQQAGAFRV